MKPVFFVFIFKESYRKKGVNMKKITTEELKNMSHQEGLILQGCGGDLQEWIDGINGILREQGILLDGKPLDDVAVFQYEGLTNLLFAFGKHKLDIGKLAIWRIQTREQFGGTWLSDYVENKLGGFSKRQQAKPDCPLIGEDGNIFNLMGIASRTLKENGMYEQAEKMRQRITGGECLSYEEALMVIADYVNITSSEPEEGMKMEFS